MTEENVENILAQFTDLLLSVGSSSHQIDEFRQKYADNAELQQLFNSVTELRANLRQVSEEDLSRRLLTDEDLEEARAQAKERAEGEKSATAVGVSRHS